MALNLPPVMGPMNAIEIASISNHDRRIPRASDREGWFKVDLELGKTYQLDVRTEGERPYKGLPNPAVEIRTWDGDFLDTGTVLISNRDGGSGNNAALFFHNDLGTATYYLKVFDESKNFGRFNIQMRELDISPGPEDDKHKTQSLKSPGTLQSDGWEGVLEFRHSIASKLPFKLSGGSSTSTKSSIDYHDDLDTFKVGLQAGATYRFAVSAPQSGTASSQLTPEITLISPSGDVVASDPNTDGDRVAALSFQALMTGTYKVNVEGGLPDDIAVDNRFSRFTTGAYIVSASGPREVRDTKGHDLIRGTSAAEILKGLAGADTIYGNGGLDVLLGGDGRDEIHGGPDADWIVGQNHNDTLHGYGGADTVFGGRGNDTVKGGADNDWLNGQWGNDTIEGNRGDDLIIGEGGEDTVLAGAGSDYVSGGDGNDWLNGQWGDDVLDGDAGNDVIIGEDGNDLLDGKRGDDYLAAGAGNDTLRGGVGNDQLYGRSGVDTLEGGGGDDTIYGNHQADRITGGSGADTVFGGRGNDTVKGGADNDWLNGQWGNDTIEGNRGDDLIIGEGGEDTVLAGAGSDYVSGGDGNDWLNGQWGDDVLDGDAGNDVIIGEDGNDLLDGKQGDDYLDGGAGNDTLRAGGGNDWMVGGDGADQFQFSHEDADPGEVYTNTIEGFEVGPDKVVELGTLRFSGIQERDVDGDGDLDTELTSYDLGTVVHLLDVSGVSLIEIV